MATVRQPTQAEGIGLPPDPGGQDEVADRNGHHADGPLTEGSLSNGPLNDDSAPGVVAPPPAEKPRITQDIIDTRIENLLLQVQANRPTEDVSHIRKAWEFCVQHHAGQERASGELYIIHPLEVAEVLAE